MMKTRMLSAVVAMTLFAAGCGKQEDTAAASAEKANTATASGAPAAREEPATATATPSADTAPAAAIASQDTQVAPVATVSGSDAGFSAGSAPPPAAIPAPSPVSAQPTPPAAVTASALTKPVSAPATTTQTTTPAKAANPPATATPAGTVIESSSNVTLNGDPGALVRADTLRARNAADAPEIAALAAGTAVKILARDGAWYQVNANGKTGWVRLMSVRRSAAATSDVAGLAGIASGRTGTGKVVTTTGVRGLDSGDLTAATFDEARIAKAETLRVSRSDAEAFARQGGLVTQSVPALPAPAK